ncbi:cytidine deaminase, partial [Mycobacterium intracellulare]|uniref:cytidine deaminase n=1 Tax=Mycobacterium intracellulare TaxID=1767 RepID=UPI000AD6A4BA
MPEIDWNTLRDKAIQVSAGAYAPYSRFGVGAAALVDDHRVVTGCNVENISYGLGLCAECAVVCALHSTGGGRLVALACVDQRGWSISNPGPPCSSSTWRHRPHGISTDPRWSTHASATSRPPPVECRAHTTAH